MGPKFTQKRERRTEKKERERERKINWPFLQKKNWIRAKFADSPWQIDTEEWSTAASLGARFDKSRYIFQCGNIIPVEYIAEFIKKKPQENLAT